LDLARAESHFDAALPASHENSATLTGVGLVFADGAIPTIVATATSSVSVARI
jgi:hypothetical protein